MTTAKKLTIGEVKLRLWRIGYACGGCELAARRANFDSFSKGNFVVTIWRGDGWSMTFAHDELESAVEACLNIAEVEPCRKSA